LIHTTSLKYTYSDIMANPWPRRVFVLICWTHENVEPHRYLLFVSRGIKRYYSQADEQTMGEDRETSKSGE